MNKYHVRDLLKYTPDELYGMLMTGGKVEVMFDDGKAIIASPQSTVYSRLLWEMYNVLPEVPITVDTHHGAQPMTPKIQMKGLDRIAKHIKAYAKAHGLLSRELMVNLGRAGFQTESDIYNFTYRHMQKYASGVSATNLVEILDHPDVRIINETVEANPQSIKRAQDNIRKIAKDPEEFLDNDLISMLRTETINPVQAGQMFSPIGYRIDVDYTILPKPIVRCFGNGLTEVVDMLMESRAATDSMASNGPPLKMSQKFYREMTLIASTVDAVLPGVDCGSKYTIPFPMTASNFSATEGMFYLEGGNLKQIAATDKHLIGTTVNLRSVMGCNLKNNSHVCGTCYGELAWVVPEGTSVGAVAATECGWGTSQAIMSKKHVAGSSMAEMIKIRKEDANHLEIGSDDSAIKFKEWMSTQNYMLYVNKAFVEMMTMIQSGIDINEINISKFSSIREIQLVNGKNEVFNLVTSMGGRWGQFTDQFIKHIIEVGYTPTATQYVIDLTEWDYGLDVLRLPSKQTDIYEFKQKFEQIFKMSGGKRNSRVEATPEAIGQLLNEFVELARSKFNIHLSHLMMLLYSTMAVNPAAGNYDLPREHQTKYFDKFWSIMRNRSLGHSCAFEQQVKVLMGIASFDRKHPRMYTRFDYFLDMRLRNVGVR